MTIFSRKTDNPSKNHKIGCTRMDIRSLTGEMVWDSIPCDQMQAEFGVCEYRIKELNETSSLHQPGKMLNLNMSDNIFTPP